MDNIERLEKQADLLMQNVSGWEQSTLNFFFQRIGKRIGKYGKLSLADVKAINNIAVVKQDMDAITKELAKTTGLNISQVERIYGDLITEQHLANEPLYDYRGKKFVPFSENKELQAIARAYAKTTGETMINLAKTKALCILDRNGYAKGLQRYYTDVLDKAVVQVASGATDFHAAMRDSIIELGGSGIRVDYGGGITRRLETVVRQNLLWGAKQASNEYNDMIGEELGCDGIEIDWHANPRPSHEFMQGKQYVLGKARTINGVRFESADEALLRLQDYGCLHFKTPIICGISEPTFSPSELNRLNKQNAQTYDIDGKTVTGYEATQMMRRLETGVREQKRIRDIARATGDTFQVRRCNEKIKSFQNKYDEISDITGIAKEPKRMSVQKHQNSSTANRSSTFKESEHFISSSEYAVNKGLTSSREFTRKIQSLTSDQGLQREYYSEIKQMLEHRSGTNGEDLKLYNPRLKKWYRSVDGTQAGSPDYNDEILLGVKEAFPNELIAFHNHPAGMPPSANDLNAALANKYAKAYTIGHDGTIFEYTAPRHRIEKYSYDLRIAKNKLLDISDYEAQIKTLDEIKEIYEFEYKEVLTDD